MAHAQTLGIEHSRARLPELVAAAHAGRSTLITRHGKPYAALVPLDEVRAARLPSAWRALKGAGAGLWGKNPAATVDALRREWD